MSWLSAKTIAAYLDVEPAWVYARLDTSAGRLKFSGKADHRKPGSGVRFDSALVARWIVERRCSSIGPPRTPTQEEIDAEELELQRHAALLRHLRKASSATTRARQRATA